MLSEQDESDLELRGVIFGNTGEVVDSAGIPQNISVLSPKTGTVTDFPPRRRASTWRASPRTASGSRRSNESGIDEVYVRPFPGSAETARLVQGTRLSIVFSPDYRSRLVHGAGARRPGGAAHNRQRAERRGGARHASHVAGQERCPVLRSDAQCASGGARRRLGDGRETHVARGTYATVSGERPSHGREWRDAVGRAVRRRATSADRWADCCARWRTREQRGGALRRVAQWHARLRAGGGRTQPAAGVGHP